MSDEVTGSPGVTIVPSPEPPAPLPLPDAVKAGVLRLAQDSDVLIIGELHGTREIPRLLAALLSDLFALGYRGLASELPSDMRQGIAMWGVDPSRALPRFFAAPGSDGRGNADTLGLIYAASNRWQILCFGEASTDAPMSWADRDARMAANLTTQRRQLCPGGKVIAVCGNLHSRIRRAREPGGAFYDHWPSLGANLADGNPYLSVSSINVQFHGGAIYNGGRIMELYEPEPLTEPYLEEDPSGEHTLILHLPRATVPPFLALPMAR